MNHQNPSWSDAVVDVRNGRTGVPVVIVCEHASRVIPDAFDDLGLSGDVLHSHVAWDPGALGVARGMARRLGATLIAAKTSRLVYDCNRPPDAPDAMPARSEIYDVPGNVGLSAAQKAQRVGTYCAPFHAAVSQVMAGRDDPILITVHSFTPIYHGHRREVEIGILHDSDARLADALLATAGTAHIVRRNEPYGPDDGVTHMLQTHALPGRHLNVMLEIRNDLVADAAAQSAMADILSDWIARALATTGIATC